MHRYSHHIYWHIHKQNRLLCCKPPEIFPEGLIPPVVTSGQARRLRRHCLVPCASSFPRVQASKLPCTDCSASAMWPCCIWSLLHVEPLHICDLPAATFKLRRAVSFFSPSLQSLVVRASDQIFHFCCRACTQASPLCSVISIAGDPGNGLHWRDHLLQRPLGRRGARGGAFGMVHRQVHMNRLPCCMPGTGASGGTAACFRVWEVGRLPYPFLTGLRLRPPEPGPPRRTAGGGGGPAVLGRYSIASIRV